MQRIELDNGLRLLLLPEAAARVFTLDVWLSVGSRYEEGYPAGIAHLTEHMLFKGTARRTSRQISEEIDNMGGVMNAYTGQEYTRYYIQTLGEYAPQAVDLLTDMLLHAAIPEKELEAERRVVLEEIAMYEDSAEDLAHDSLVEHVWQGDPLGTPISGTPQSVMAIDGITLHRFLQENYTADRMTVVCAGDFDPVAMEALLRRALGGLSKGRGLQTGAPPVFHHGVVCRRKDFEQVSLELGFRGLPTGDADRFALSLLTAIVGGGESSRLYQRLREELGLTYGIFAANYDNHGAGLYAVCASVSPENQQQALLEIGREIRRLVEEGVSEEELRRTKAHAKISLLMSQETVAARAARVGRGEVVMGRQTSVDEVLARWDSLQAADLQALARRLFGNVPALAAVGPVATREEYAQWLQEAFGGK
ncbi:MAG: insulinase family protein [Clostridia bacterium]|nr:insulinase family protein [Clostridia bacterium]